MGTVWVVISASEAKDRLVEMIDSGYLAEAVGFSNALNAMVEKMKSFVQQYGGSIPLHLYERIIMQVPSTAAEQIPKIISGYSDALNNKVAVGIGMTMQEASAAAQKSVYTGEIEMYEKGSGEDDYVQKSGMKARRWKSDVVLPTNIFDPTIPDETAYVDEPPKSPKMPSIDEQMQAEAKLIEQIANQMGAGAMQQQQEQMMQQMQQAQQQQAQPRDLLETLNGGQIDGYNPQTEEAAGEGGSEQGGEGKPEGGPENAAQGAEGASDQEAQELEAEIAEAEKDTSDDRIAMTLDNIRNQIPQIMGLAEKDPKSFKQTMDMINKLIQLAHSKSKETKKSEMRLQIEELEKDINNLASQKPKTGHLRYPVGTRLGRYKKVLVDGRETWRSLSSGITQDDKGSPISVREYNKERTQDQREEPANE